MRPGDQHIIDALLAKEEALTYDFFYVWCRPLLYSLIRKTFPYPVDYDELVGELYLHLMENNGRRLRTFQGRSSIYQWMKCVAARFFLEKRDSRMRELLTLTAPDPPVLPMLAEAAADTRDNFCNIRCEQYVLQYFGVSVSEEELVAKSTSEEWLKEGGIPLFRMGSLCAAYGLSVSWRYDATSDDIREALRQGYQVIVAVDGGEIDGDEGAEAPGPVAVFRPVGR